MFHLSPPSLHSAVFLVGVWLTVVNKRPVLPYLLSPRPFYPQGKETAEPSREAVLQSLLLSVNRTTAFELGQLAQHLSEHGEDADCVSDDRGGCKPVLERATELVGSRERLTADEMGGIGHLIKRGEEEEAGKKMMWERVRGLFSFVNVMWALAILGIACSLGPVVYYLLHPLATVLLTLTRAVWQHLVYPLLLLSRPLFELLAYYICLLFIVHGHCIKEALDEQTGEGRTETALRLFHVSTSTVPVYVALTGCMLAIPAFIFSLKLHSPPDAESKYLGPVLNGFLTLMLVPVAVALDSQLLGFLAIWTLFGVLGRQGRRSNGWMEALSDAMCVAVCVLVVVVRRLRAVLRAVLVHRVGERKGPCKDSRLRLLLQHDLHHPSSGPQHDRPGPARTTGRIMSNAG